MSIPPPFDDVQSVVQMLDLLPDRLARYRRDDLRILYVNQAQAARSGCTPEEMIGRPASDFVYGEYLAAMLQDMRELTPEQPTGRHIIHKNGRWTEWSLKLIPSPDGDEIVAIGRDVTEHRAAQARLYESESRFDLAMQVAPIGMAVIGLDGRILRVNEALCRFLRRSEQELLSMTTLDFTHPDHVEVDRELGRAILTGAADAPDAILTRYVRGDGTFVWGMARLSLVHDREGHPLYLVGQVIDVTEQIEREQSLEREASLERDTAARLRELDELKDAFISAVSHELRTPLTLLKGFAELLRARHHELNPAEIDDLLDRLVHNANRLTDLLGDLLDLDRLVRGGSAGTRREGRDLAALVMQVIEATDVPTWRLTCYLEPVFVDVEVAKIERVVANLLVNAVRHTAPNTPIWVRVCPDCDGALLIVEDAGPGIPDALKERIFEPFLQSGTEATTLGGTGIGLAVVLRFVKLHGGRVWVEDRAGGGASFHVWLPTQAT